MENPMLSSDLNTLKELLQEPILYIKEEFTTAETTTEPLVDLTQVPTIQTIGKNKMGIVFLVFSAESELSSLDKDLYTKTLSALKLSNDDVAFGIASLGHANQYDEISSGRMNQKIVCFGSTALYKEGILLKEFIRNEAKFLPCPSLYELSSHQELKIRWWNALKAFLS